MKNDEILRKSQIKIDTVQNQGVNPLSGIIAAVGLAQNFAGLRALASEGIQRGHMKLHTRNMAVQAGAKDNEVDQVVELAVKEGKFRFDDIKRFLKQLRNH